MKTTTQARLKQIMHERNLKQVTILNMSLPYQEKLGIKMSKSHLSQYVNGKSSPDQHKLYLLAVTLGVNEAWLMGYDVEQQKMPDNNRKESTDITHIYNELNEINQKDVYRYAERKLEKQNKPSIIKFPQQIEEEQVTYLSVFGKVSAGTGELLPDQEQKEEKIYHGRVPKKYDLVLEVSGDSMEPMFEDGEILFVRKKPDIYNGQIGIVTIDGEAYVKKIYIEDHHLRLVSLNKKYEDIIANEKNNIEIIGRVVL